jgi:hypothetical protein
MKLSMKLDAAEMAQVAWGRPDSPQRNLCARCHGALPDVPVQLCKEDGSAIALCDECFERMLR